MGKEKAYELRDKKKNELLKKVEELKTELAQVRGTLR
jgi:ribosomal protein L29